MTDPDYITSHVTYISSTYVVSSTDTHSLILLRERLRLHALTCVTRGQTHCSESLIVQNLKVLLSSSLHFGES